jgi:hypothetical protein
MQKATAFKTIDNNKKLNESTKNVPSAIMGPVQTAKAVNMPE